MVMLRDGALVLLLAAGCAMPPPSPVRPALTGSRYRPAPDDSDLDAIGQSFWQAVRDRDEEGQVRRFAAHLKQKTARDAVRESMQLFTWQSGVLKSWRLKSRRSDGDGKYRYDEKHWEYELQCSRAIMNAVLTFHPKTRNIIDLAIAREPVHVAAPVPGDEDSVSWTDTTVGPDLGATITTPRVPAGNKLPAVVLVGESGPWDRDETYGPLRPFRDIGDGLAARGVVTIRFDKRSFVWPGQFLQYTLDEDLIQDGVSAVKVLRRHHLVDPARIFIVGHGLGGLAAVAIARRSEGVAGLVLAGVSARPFIYIALEQLRDREPGEEVLAQVAQQVQAIIDRRAPLDAKILGAPAGFWYDLADRNSVDDLRSLGRPVLLLRGEDDTLATAIDQQRWVANLAGLPVRSEAIPLVNHLLVTPPPHPLAPADIEAGVGPRVPKYLLDMIAEFVSKPEPRRKAPARTKTR